MASSSLASGKITLRSTSKIPLSERFKLVQQTAIIKKNIEPVTRTPRVSLKPLARGSLKNRQLAAALANKPSVRAALAIKKKSIKQRLNVKPKPVRGNVAKLGNRSTARKATKSIIERLQMAPSTSGNSRRPKLNRNNFIGSIKVAPKNLRRGNRRQGGNVSSIDTGNRRPLTNKLMNKNYRKVNNNNGNNQVNRSPRQGYANTTARRSQQRFNQQMKNRRINPNNNFKNNNQLRQPQRQRQFNNRRNNQQGTRPRGDNKNGPGNRNNNRRFQNRRPNNRQGQQRRKPVDKNSLDKDLDAYMASFSNP